MIDLSIIDRVVDDNSSAANRQKMLDLIAKADGADYDTMFKAQPSALATGNEGVEVPRYLAQPDANAKNYSSDDRSATAKAVDSMRYDEFMNNLTGETGGSNYLQNVIDAGMPQQKINIPMLDVDADYYGPMINVPANPSKKSAGKPIDEKAIEKEKKKISDKIAETMVAPLRQPASFEMPRSRIGLAMIQDRLDDINNPNRRSRMADNAAFTGMTSEDQMQQALSAKEDEYRTMVDRFNAALGLQKQKLSTQESDLDREQVAKQFALKALDYKYNDPLQQAKMQDLEDDRKIKLIQILSRAMNKGDDADRIKPIDVLKNEELFRDKLTQEQIDTIILKKGLGL